jgi:hypothetical protein
MDPKAFLEIHAVLSVAGAAAKESKRVFSKEGSEPYQPSSGYVLPRPRFEPVKKINRSEKTRKESVQVFGPLLDFW